MSIPEPPRYKLDEEITPCLQLWKANSEEVIKQINAVEQSNAIEWRELYKLLKLTLEIVNNISKINEWWNEKGSDRGKGG